jgi:hypothetical protein
MSGPNPASEALVVATNRSEYYVIPKEVLARFRATPEEKEQIDNAAAAMVPGSFAPLRADEASVKPSFASTPRRTLLAWFQSC